MNKEFQPKSPQELFNSVMNAGKESLTDLETLSHMALCRHQEARDLIAQIDQATANGELALPFPSPKKQKPIRTNKRIMMPPEHPIF